MQTYHVTLATSAGKPIEHGGGKLVNVTSACRTFDEVLGLCTVRRLRILQLRMVDAPWQVYSVPDPDIACDEPASGCSSDQSPTSFRNLAK